MKRITAVAMVLCLVFLWGFSLAQERPLGQVYDALEDLLLNTDNVTMRMTANFDFEGAEFKRMSAEYIQSGFDSLMEVNMSTVRRRSQDWRDTGYRVLAKDGEGYAVDFGAVNNYYSFTPLWNDTPMSREKSGTLFSMAAAMSALLEKPLSPFVTSEDSTIRLSMAESEAPRDLGPVVKAVISYLANRYMDVSGVGWAEKTPEESWQFVVYEEWICQWEAAYEKLTGEKAPLNYFYRMWTWGATEEEEELYNKVLSFMDEEEQQLLEAHPEAAVIRLRTDGTAEIFETYGEYLVAQGEEELMFDDIEATFMTWYKSRTGRDLTRPQIRRIQWGDNEALYSAYIALQDEMREDYLAKLREQKMAAGYVYGDGTMDTSMDPQDFSYQDTVARRALSYMNDVRLGDTAVSVTMDARGRLDGAVGEMTLYLIDREGEEHPLHFTFALSVTDYGISDLADTDMALFENRSEPITSIELDGVVYDLPKE